MKNIFCVVLGLVFLSAHANQAPEKLYKYTLTINDAEKDMPSTYGSGYEPLGDVMYIVNNASDRGCLDAYSPSYRRGSSDNLDEATWTIDNAIVEILSKNEIPSGTVETLRAEWCSKSQDNSCKIDIKLDKVAVSEQLRAEFYNPTKKRKKSWKSIPFSTLEIFPTLTTRCSSPSNGSKDGFQLTEEFENWLKKAHARNYPYFRLFFYNEDHTAGAIWELTLPAAKKK